mmetsp:Transcript_22560/g.57707  ORF Transcript_22560/g.57707 Transcript_22560/m.57707 type:complete len:164 (-) Transcript_22560:127-618(-)
MLLVLSGLATAATYAYMLALIFARPELQTTLDTPPGWSVATVGQILGSNPELESYRQLNTVDFYFLFLYSSFLSLCLVRYWPTRQWLSLLPFAAGFADLIENACVRMLLDSFPRIEDAPQSLLWGPPATVLKFVFLLSMLVAIAAGVLFSRSMEPGATKAKEF